MLCVCVCGGGGGGGVCEYVHAYINVMYLCAKILQKTIGLEGAALDSN